MQRDAGQLAELGYDQQLKRDIGLFSVFSIGVATVAPVVGLYAIFSLGIQLTAPAWTLMLLLSLAGQLTVAFVYSELASEFPIAGGPYHWTTRLACRRYGMFTGSVYALPSRRLSPPSPISQPRRSAFRSPAPSHRA